MKYQNIVNIKFAFLLVAVILAKGLFAQTSPSKLLVRDSLDFKRQPLNINSSQNEFSPILYKGGLLYMSKKPIEGRRDLHNRVYWTNDANFKIGDSLSGLLGSYKLTKMQRSDDYTAPTSNDNDILTHYKKLRLKNNDVEKQFLPFSSEQAFAYNDNCKLIIFAKKRKALFSKVGYWELWQANLLDGKLKNKKRLKFDDKKADYLYPFLDSNCTKLYFASNKLGGQGGYDIYFVDKGAMGFSNKPIPVSSLNSQADDLSYYQTGDQLFFSSNRSGGIGGFDMYKYENNEVKNLAYPLNSSGDEVSLQLIGNDYTFASNRLGNFDIQSLKYAPVVYPITGVLLYKNDNTLAPNHILYLKEEDDVKLSDTLTTDHNANFAFSGKPNRNYVFTTLNGDQVIELLPFKTVADQKDFFYTLKISGRSPKQIADSLALIEKNRLDSIAANSLATKFIVHYGFNKSTLTAKENKVLDSLLIKLSAMPKVNIAIGAFTDCIGSYKYNYRLSVKRAKTVVAYLLKHGLEKSRIITNGYSKKYNITPCSTKFAKRNKQLQQNNRRAEIVLTEKQNTNWEILEKTRGASFYKVYDASSQSPIGKYNVVKPAKEEKTKIVIKEKKPKVKLEVANKVKVDTVSKQFKSSVKTDTIIKLDTIVKQVKDTSSHKSPASKNATIKTALVKNTPNTTTTPIASKVIVKVVDTPKIIVATASTPKEEDDLSKEDIIKALDSLAKLKKEQERIVEYLTKRINKKPIDIYVSSDSVSVEIYDNGIHDKDSVSVIYNNRIIVDRKELKVNNPIKFKLKVDKNKKNNELVLVAENLGVEPPNTAVMFITEKSGRRQQVMLSTDMTHNEVVYFIRIAKE